MALAKYIEGFNRNVDICFTRPAIRSNSIEYSIDRATESPLSRICGMKNESVRHVISGCKKLAQKEYKR